MKQGNCIKCDGCGTTENVLPFGPNDFCSSCAIERVAFDAAVQHLRELLAPRLTEIMAALEAYWGPHGLQRSDLTWIAADVVQEHLKGMKASE